MDSQKALKELIETMECLQEIATQLMRAQDRIAILIHELRKELKPPWEN